MDQTRYKEKYLEKKFLESENFMRLFLFTGPLFYIIFSIADYIKYTNFAFEFLILRIAISLLILLSFFAIRRRKSFLKNQIGSMLWTFLTTAGIAYMIYRSRDPFSSYYIGITLVLVFSLTFGVYEKKLYILTLVIANLPYLALLFLNYKTYYTEWRELSTYWIFNIGFIAAITTAHIRRNHDYADIINAELNLENEILDRQKIIENNRLEISILKSKELEFLQKSFQFDLAQKVSHDIRSPLSTLNIISSRIENHELQQLHQSVIQQINSISNDLLNFSKSEASLLYNITESETIDFIKIFKLLDSEFKIKRELLKRDIHFSIDVSKLENCSLPTNFATSLYSIINNLIQNSIEATREVSGIISIKTSADNDNFSITVTDNGCGMPDHILKKIGKEKFTYGKSDDNLFSGNGIAIYNASRFINNNNGFLSINSNPNGGITVKIILPKKIKMS